MDARAPDAADASVRSGSPTLITTSTASRDRGRQRKAPPESEPDEDCDEDGRERSAEPEQRVEDEHGRRDTGWVERGRQRVQSGDREAEADPEERGCDEQQRERNGGIRLEELTDDQEHH